MQTIKVSDKNFKELSKLYDYFYEIYGDENTIWDFDDLEEMRQTGQEFMDILSTNFKK